MNSKKIKKLRKQYRNSIKKIANKDVKQEIFRLARLKDIFWLVTISESITIVILLFLLLK